jgi:hypothetical protein
VIKLLNYKLLIFISVFFYFISCQTNKNPTALKNENQIYIKTPNISLWRNRLPGGRLNVIVTDTVLVDPPLEITITLETLFGDKETLVLGPSLFLYAEDCVSYCNSINLKSDSSLQQYNDILEAVFETDSITVTYRSFNAGETAFLSASLDRIHEGMPFFTKNYYIILTAEFGKNDALYASVSELTGEYSLPETEEITLLSGLGDSEKFILPRAPIPTAGIILAFGSKIETAITWIPHRDNNVLEIKSSGDIIHGIYVRPCDGEIQINSISFNPQTN